MVPICQGQSGQLGQDSGVETSGEEEVDSWTPFSRFGRDGEEGQRWMPFSMMTRPRFGKRTSSEENIVGRVLDLAEHGVRQRFGRKKLDLEF